MFLKKNIFTTLFAICCISIICCSQTTATYCSLDVMKEHAMDACEHLYSLESEVRERRSLDNHLYNHKHKKSSKFLVHISRSSYPRGGYLKVTRDHYNQLSLMDVSPRYKPTKLNHLKHEMTLRKKREDNDFYRYGNNIAFCCFNKCEEEFFC